MDNKYYVTLASGKYAIKPVSEQMQALIRSAVEKEFKEKGELLERPTYEVDILGGGKKTELHDETTVQTDEEKAALKAFENARAKLETEQNNRVQKAILMGLDVKLPEDESWITEQRFLGVVVPEDPVERRYHYITTVVATTLDDFMEIMREHTKALYGSAIKNEDVDALIAGFLSSIQGKTSAGLEKQARRLGNS